MHPFEQTPAFRRLAALELLILREVASVEETAEYVAIKATPEYSSYKAEYSRRATARMGDMFPEILKVLP